jgi:hypothetical protein
MFVQWTDPFYEPRNNSVPRQNVKQTLMADTVKCVLKVQRQDAYRGTCGLVVSEDVPNTGYGVQD